MIGCRSAKVSAALLPSLCPGPTGMTGRRIMQRDLTPVARSACNQASRASSLAFTLVPVFLVVPSLFHLPHPFPRSLHHHSGRTADGGWIVNFFSGIARRLVTRLDIIKKCPGTPALPPVQGVQPLACSCRAHCENSRFNPRYCAIT